MPRPFMLRHAPSLERVAIFTGLAGDRTSRMDTIDGSMRYSLYYYYKYVCTCHLDGDGSTAGLRFPDLLSCCAAMCGEERVEVSCILAGATKDTVY